jgi:N-acetyl-gamma-glutamyl-phosphate reductase
MTTDELLSAIGVGELRSVEIAFLAMPHGASEKIVPTLRSKVATIVDLAADFRLADPDQYRTHYGRVHGEPDLLAQAVYGLPELDRTKLPGASLIAVAGCYVTAATLGVLPLVEEHVIESDHLIVDAASGVSGAGRSLKEENLFVGRDANFSVYGLRHHRHVVEMEQNLGVRVLFTPHLLPVSRGILATIYARPTPAFAAELLECGNEASSDLRLREIFETRYRGDEFVDIVASPPDLSSVVYSNLCRISAVYDPRTNWVIVIVALDNLTKGAAGQALQCANIAVGYLESEGLPKGGRVS